MKKKKGSIFSTLTSLKRESVKVKQTARLHKIRLKHLLLFEFLTYSCKSCENLIEILCFNISRKTLTPYANMNPFTILLIWLDAFDFFHFHSHAKKT